jgi:hypothetical protein
MRWLAVVLLALPLAGCFDDQKAALAKCKLDARRTYPSEKWLDIGPAASYIETCMQAAGYDVDHQQKRCKLNMAAYDLPTNALCYRPAGRISNVIYEVEMRLTAQE